MDSGRLKEVVRLIEVKSNRLALIGTLIADCLIEVAI